MNLPEPQLEPISDKEWRLIRRFSVVCGRWRIILHPGFVTDGASIPRVGLIWMLVGHPLQGLVLPAAIVHDGLYRIGGPDGMPRAECDEIFYKLMLANGVNRVKAWAMYRAVRSFGWVTWRKNTRTSIAKALPFVEVEDSTAAPPEAEPVLVEPEFVG